jgi:hypothetical protein
MKQENILDKKDYQVFVIGRKDEQNGDEFVRTPSEVREDLAERGLGGSRFLNLQLIEDFNAGDDFGGSSDAEQVTLFESTAPFHFGQLLKAINNPEKWTKEEDRMITNSQGEKETVPVIKMKGNFKASAIHVEGVDPFYLVFKRDGEYELQVTDRLIGNDWIGTPSVQDTVTIVLLGGDAKDGNVISAVEREKRRMNVEPFNRDEIRELAKEAVVNIADVDEFKAWIAKIAPSRIMKYYGSEDEAATGPEPSIKEGAESGQPAAEGDSTQATPKPTGTEGTQGEAGSQGTGGQRPV